MFSTLVIKPLFDKLAAFEIERSFKSVTSITSDFGQLAVNRFLTAG
jgi:hypothetical protein